MSAPPKGIASVYLGHDTFEGASAGDQRLTPTSGELIDHDHHASTKG